jgi:uncharacterized repeat protein (TIGR01451 family)
VCYYTGVLLSSRFFYKDIFMNKLITLGISLVLLLAAVKPAAAFVRCETQYGGGETCVKTGELQIDKEIWNPDMEKFVDNMGLNDRKFYPGDEIIFRLKIKNVGDSAFGQVEVRDYLPNVLNLENGDIAFDLHDLKPGDVREVEIKTTVVEGSEFPDNKTLICDVNTAEAWSGDERDKDTSRFCVAQHVLGATTLPKTGPEYLLVSLLFSSFAGIAGLALIKAK